MKQSAAYKKGFKRGYNNPGQFDQTKLLKSNTEIAKGVVAGICQRQQDNANNTVSFKLSISQKPFNLY